METQGSDRIPSECRRMRSAIDEWLDQRKPGLPEWASPHLRACASCRRAVSRWNAAELALMNVRSDTPEAQPHAAEQILAAAKGLRAERLPRALATGYRLHTRWIAVGAAALAIGCALAVPPLRMAAVVSARAGAKVVMAALGRRTNSIRGDLPIAHTR